MAEATTPQARRAAAVLSTLTGSMGLSDSTVAQRLGRSRQWVQQRRAGRDALDFNEVDQLADALGVPVLLFYMEPTEALRWVLDNRSDLLIRSSGCIAA